jgi:hypothetical protein
MLAAMTIEPGSKPPLAQDLRVPIVIGVTGHRKLWNEDVGKLEGRVRKIFADLRHDYPDTPWIVISPLAEGADQLVVRVAQRLFQPHDQLVTLLPMPVEAYLEYFNDEASREEFRRLSHNALALELWDSPEISANYSNAETRNDCYEKAGAYIARQSQILIALWDKTRQGSSCGTARVVEFRRQGLPAKFQTSDSPYTMDGTGPVYLIEPPKGASEKPEVKSVDDYTIVRSLPWNERIYIKETNRELARKWHAHRNHPQVDRRNRFLHSLLKVRTAFDRNIERLDETLVNYQRKRRGLAARAPGNIAHHRSLKCLDRFNAKVSWMERQPNQIENCRKSLITPDNESYSDLLTETTRHILDRYAVSDALAMSFQRKQRSDLLSICALGVVSGSLFQWYADIEKSPYLILGYLLFLFVAVSIFVCSKIENAQEQYLDYRAVAEGMRVALMWKIAGLDQCVADYYLQQQHGELAWIRFALRNWHLANGIRGIGISSSSVSAAHYDLICECWLQHQARYHSLSSRRRSDYRDIYEAAVALLSLSILALSVYLCLSGFLNASTSASDRDNWLILVIGVLVACATATATYAEKTGLSAESRQFARMIDPFMRACSVMDAFADEGSQTEKNILLLSLGKEALDENALWVIMHRERTLEVHVS